MVPCRLPIEYILKQFRMVSNFEFEIDFLDVQCAQLQSTEKVTLGKLFKYEINSIGWIY